MSVVRQFGFDGERRDSNPRLNFSRSCYGGNSILAKGIGNYKINVVLFIAIMMVQGNVLLVSIYAARFVKYLFTVN